ncbi:unnamed protein product [Didymodactylos carnosus]|uniref:Uncharacterized protein n=1 Tax=Didymodactylos carnosus TaxID=1234261 RepID=A0A814TQA5_9BILA|nr:unnamed protein product [Didymodactylos carnosus]CAF1163929.1 unnamed protein product [Didymodactylos carnosus]CAF3861124.1 unnamed protein product [Didymodactylos carnosus]CAF3927547.1 unnamed protein product [Didymodactylos carnosus]
MSSSSSSHYQSSYVNPTATSSTNHYAGSSTGRSSTSTNNSDNQIRRDIQDDWQRREGIQILTTSIKRLTDFLNQFESSCRYRLSTLNEKLTSLERQVNYLEARVSKGETLN